MKSIALPLLLFVLVLTSGQIRAEARARGAVKVGVVVQNPTAEQMRQLVKHFVELELRDGSRLRARIVMVDPVFVGVVYPGGNAGAVKRANIRRVILLRRDFLPTPRAAGAPPPGRKLKITGIVLTIGGLVLTGGLGIPLMVVGLQMKCDALICGSAILGMFATSFSALTAMVGVPLWVAGSVRNQTRAKRGAARKIRIFRRWGAALCFTGLGVAVAGGALYGASFSDLSRLNIMDLVGQVTVYVGALIGLGIGLPMWVEARRAASEPKGLPPPRPQRRPLSPPTAQARDPSLLRQAWRSPVLRVPTTTMFGYGWQF